MRLSSDFFFILIFFLQMCFLNICIDLEKVAEGLMEYESLSGGEIVDLLNGKLPNIKGNFSLSFFVELCFCFLIYCCVLFFIYFFECLTFALIYCQ